MMREVEGSEGRVLGGEIPPGTYITRQYVPLLRRGDRYIGSRKTFIKSVLGGLFRAPRAPSLRSVLNPMCGMGSHAHVRHAHARCSQLG